MIFQSLADFVASRTQSVARIKRNVRPLLPSASSPALSLPKEDKHENGQGSAAPASPHKGTSLASPAAEAPKASTAAELPVKTAHEDAVSAPAAEKAIGDAKSSQQHESVSATNAQPGKESSTVGHRA